MDTELEQQKKFFVEDCVMETDTLKNVSIIIPSYNRKDLLQKNLEAINNQKYKDYLEIIVVDDGSTDGTLQMLKSKAALESKLHFKYFSTLHTGPARARNLGISHAKGDILIFLDDDSVIQNDNYIQKMVESFKEKNIGIVAGRTFDFYSGTLKLIRAGDPPEIDFDHPLKFKSVVGVPTKNAAFLKDAVQKVGAFDPIFRYAYGEDVDLCIRVLNLGYKLTFNKEALVYHYPTYDFKGYIKKSYQRGFSNGIFRSIYPDKFPKYSLSKTIILPVLVMNNFLKKTRECLLRNFFSKSILVEMAQMLVLISASYYAIYSGEIHYLLTRNLILLKIVKDLIKYFLELIKYGIKAISPPFRRTFILYLTNKCNERCQHCFYSDSINKNIQQPSLEEIRKIAKLYYKFTNTNKFLASNISQGFTGGEPFLRDDLLEIISIFKIAGVRHFQINTNGILTDKIIKFSKNLLEQNIPFKIITSIDGLEQTHNKIRNLSGAFQKTIQTIKKLKEIGVDVGTIVTINKLNYKEIGEVVKFLNINCNIEPGLQLMRGVSQSNAPEEYKGVADPLEKDIFITNDIIPEIREIIYETYFEKSIQDPFRLVEFVRKVTYLQCHLDILENKKRLFTCVAGKSVGVIYQNGDLALCEFYKPIGNLKKVNFDLLHLWSNSLAQRQRNYVKKCFCNHDCFINIQHNLKFAKLLVTNLHKFVTSPLEKKSLNMCNKSYVPPTGFEPVLPP